jgi:hypothetical protein
MIPGRFMHLPDWYRSREHRQDVEDGKNDEDVDS